VRPFYAGRNWKPQAENVFIAMPFDPQYEEFYQNHIKNAIESCGLRAVRVDKTKITDPNVTIMDLVKTHLATCRFVVADVTGFRANVLYEVGLAHAVGKRVLFMCEDKYKNERGLLFDISAYFHLFYSPYKPQTFMEELRGRIRDMKDHPA
jgi:nucleoside 2-deoxyribosyltransferase